MPRTDEIGPRWPTTLRRLLADGRAIGVDGSVWLVRQAPMAPVADAVSPGAALAAAEPLLAAFEELASLTPVRVARRSVARGSYRQVHLLLTNIPRRFSPPAGHPIAELFSPGEDREVDQRSLLLAVRLTDRIGGGGGFRSAVDSVVETLVAGSTPLSDFDTDFAAVDTALGRAGMTVPSRQALSVAKAWWNHGGAPDVTTLVHSDHLHVFSTPSAARSAANLGESDCMAWPPIPGHHALAFGAVESFDLPFVDEASPKAQWVSALLDAGAVCVSIRGRVEPSKVTRAELRRQRKRYIDDVRERASQGKMERAEQEELLAELTEVESVYAVSGPPSLVDASVIAVFSGRDERTGYDVSEVVRDAGVILNTMVARQDAALAETWLCSSVRANPHLHDLPAHTIACSGLPSLSVVGDRTGALVGFTERDRQPAFISHTAPSEEDSLPIFISVGQTGAGKSLMMLFLAHQFAQMRDDHGRRTSCIIIDPKTSSAHDDAVALSGGQVVSLDNLVSADGVFDPLRFSHEVEDGIELASSMLMQINPWGSRREDFETPLMRALSYGVSEGAQCTGAALRLALEAGVAPAEMVDRVFDLAEASPMFRALVGVNPGSTALSVSEGITLIKVGRAHLNLPEPGAATAASQQQRIALAMVRMMVFGSAAALAGRQGVVCLDEAWVFTGAGRTEMDRLGRLARSQQVFPMLFTQRISDALDAGLAGYISRGMILPITDQDEAIAACELFKLEPTKARLERITARDRIGAGDSAEAAPNWHSMRALRDPGTGRTLRGAIGIYVDLAGRAVPVEVTIPAAFLARASTNAADIRARQLGLAGGPERQPPAPPPPPPAPATAPASSADPWADWSAAPG